METKPGKETSEHAHAKAAGLMGWIALILGVVTTQGALLVQHLSQGHEHATWAVIAGAVIAAFGLVQSTLVKLGYIKSRTEVKTKGK